ncbi:hypothetical protein E3Q22_01398 [Wallemia mellicola]|uniref:tRNA-splicing endonuclease subunit Sen15 domain-containing protein n=2 Tax=Wallemia mellicola TaxID=1708541 RepID=A0A4V6TPY3_9BASI|nr:hypothetical protein WALSEDRAFT_54224 [Wallemia mellicola CBS 633.66]TIB71642.1 hypothetical protein E3Q24_02147 [Wallemia mellicola]EIM22010.1 hypothetical protein WALSEDRAFT_54224 [Wallemia mellicola CBS 633.66]TIB79212.1 hypothetical protein E3Q23_00371 [Wallemia mellicola]TIB81166.1 hypothetical protein E3Q22_01398 [Wallemia mellicola]TIB84332.1 hypothetical protein E3Q21_02423 [Wallemia mellicola]|eukprot:XP_006957819.1 hypothetical protein WALSEDRAFT_54224 [Wallemia mellicola CBS 633.66]
MESTYKFKHIQPYLSKYPKLSLSLFQTYHDLSLSQKWYSIDFIELEELKYVILVGKKTMKHNDTVIIPTNIYDNLSLDLLNNIISSTDYSRDVHYISIVGQDSSCVYYRIQAGLMKPDDLRVL